MSSLDLVTNNLTLDFTKQWVIVTLYDYETTSSWTVLLSSFRSYFEALHTPKSDIKVDLLNC